MSPATTAYLNATLFDASDKLDVLYMFILAYIKLNINKQFKIIIMLI